MTLLSDRHELRCAQLLTVACSHALTWPQTESARPARAFALTERELDTISQAQVEVHTSRHGRRTDVAELILEKHLHDAQLPRAPKLNDDDDGFRRLPTVA